MAHAIVEWTSNLEGTADIHGLLQLIARHMREAGDVFPWGGIRVRAIRLDDYVIADDRGEDAFVHITVKMGAGRPASFKKTFYNELFEAIKAHFSELYVRRSLALSLYVEEPDPAYSYKHNNIHLRLRQSG